MQSKLHVKTKLKEQFEVYIGLLNKNLHRGHSCNSCQNNPANFAESDRAWQNNFGIKSTIKVLHSIADLGKVERKLSCLVNRVLEFWFELSPYRTRLSEIWQATSEENVLWCRKSLLLACGASLLDFRFWKGNTTLHKMDAKYQIKQSSNVKP